jgi:hypothetical protein
MVALRLSRRLEHRKIRKGLERKEVRPARQCTRPAAIFRGWDRTRFQQLAGREACEIAEGLQDGRQQDLGTRREARPDGRAGAGGSQTRGCARQAQGRKEGPSGRACGPGRAGAGQGQQEGLSRQGRVQGEEGREGAGSRRAPRGQQNGPGDGDASAQGRGRDFGGRADHGLAASHSPRVHGRRDEEGGGGSNVFVEKVKQSLDFRRQSRWAGEKRA